MDFGTIRRTAERFILENFGNVRAVRITEIRESLWDGRLVYHSTGLATIHSNDILPTFGSPIRVDLSTDKDGKVIAVQGEKWHNYQRTYKLLLRKGNRRRL